METRYSGRSLLEIKSYKTAWLMGHKIRKAMADRDARYTLAELVEMDESFFGPPSVRFVWRRTIWSS